ncbi:MAG: protein kinase [Casimicrobium sp.]
MDTPSQQNLNQLPIGSTLGDFTITGIVGEGGFGIVYLAYEAALDRVVAIKEYLPSSIAGRTGNQSVMVRSQLNTNAYASGLKNFLREAQMLAKFSHAALVEVHRVWEQNSTAYMAMRFYDGKTLREWRLVNEDFDETRIRRLMEPVFDALSLLHAQNVIHRDVSPDNILMRESGTPVLLDLGAARLVIGGMTQALTTILKPGYAPIEQYVDDGTMPQGPWTDVYGLGAVLYYMLTGVAPPQAVARMITDPLRNIANVVRVPVPADFLEAVVKALAVRPENRFQSVDDLRDALGWTDPLPAEPRTQYARTEYTTRSKSSSPTVKTGPVTSGPLSAAIVAPPLPTAVVTTPTLPSAPAPAPPPAPYVAAAVFMPAMTQPPAVAAPSELIIAPADTPDDDDKTVVWKGPAIAAAKPVPPPRAIPPARPVDVAPTHAYGDAAVGGNKSWLYVGLAAAAVAAGAAYFALQRAPSTTKVPDVPAAVVVSPVVTPQPSVTPPVASTPVAPVAVAPTPAAPSVSPPPVKPPAVVTPPPTVAPVASNAAEDERIAKAKLEARDKAKLEAQEKAAKAKSDADDRAKKLRADAEERAAVQRAEQEEKARKAREEEDRQAAVRAKQEADRIKAASSVMYPSNGLVVTPVRRTVDQLSAAGSAAFKRGDVTAARAAWNELVNHPDATGRSKAIAYNNLAVSYCQGGDETNCERMYASMLRADRAYGAEVSERDMAQFKRAFERAARQARVPGY